MSEITHRTKTRPVKVGPLTIGGNNEVVIQSMTTTKTHDVEATVAEINRLAEADVKSSASPVLMNGLQTRFLRSKSGYPFLLSWIFISTINWL